jgi:hypothetical protein
MKLKTATLIALIGQIVTFVYWGCYSIFHLYRHLGHGGDLALNLTAKIIGEGSIILFFIVLYSKQKGSANE